MPILNWNIKRKLIYFFLALFFLAVAVFSVYFLTKAGATCSDGKQNQNEENVDCGGVCRPCVANPKDIAVLWTRVFSAGAGLCNVASLIENPNLFYGLSLFKYVFKIYDVDNVLVAVKESQTFLNPKDKFIVFVPAVQTGQRVASKAFMEIEYFSPWQYSDKEKTPVVVSEKNFYSNPVLTLQSRLRNQSLSALKNVEASAVLYDAGGNALAVSSTKIDLIPAESEQQIFFTWPYSLGEEVVSSEIFIRMASSL